MSAQLRIEHLGKKFEAGTPNEKTALEDLTLCVEQGEFLTILGSNGAGKSTLFHAILGKFRPDTGRIFLDGEDITFQKDYKRALNIGCLYQNPMRGTAPHMTIEENLALAYTRKSSHRLFAVNRRDCAYFRELLATLGLGLEDRMKTPMGLLSGGQRQAAALLMATIAKPKLLLLDEHTAALDPGTAKKVLQITREIIVRDGLTALMITHNMEMALSFGSRTLLMDSGRLVMDLDEAQRRQMTPEKLVHLFSEHTGGRGFSDRTLLASGH